jgi:hypothetical protein
MQDVEVKIPILDISSLSDEEVAKFFSHSVGCLFSLVLCYVEAY